MGLYKSPPPPCKWINLKFKVRSLTVSRRVPSGVFEILREEGESFILPVAAFAIFLHKFPGSDKGNLLWAGKTSGISWRRIIPAITLFAREVLVLVKLSGFLFCKDRNRWRWGGLSLITFPLSTEAPACLLITSDLCHHFSRYPSRTLVLCQWDSRCINGPILSAQTESLKQKQVSLGRWAGAEWKRGKSVSLNLQVFLW